MNRSYWIAVAAVVLAACTAALVLATDLDGDLVRQANANPKISAQFGY